MFRYRTYALFDEVASTTALSHHSRSSLSLFRCFKPTIKTPGVMRITQCFCCSVSKTEMEAVGAPWRVATEVTSEFLFSTGGG